MKRILSLFLAFVLLCAALLTFSSCGSKEHEIYRYTYGESEFVECIDIDPFRVDPGEIVACKKITYMDGEVYRIEPCFVGSDWATEKIAGTAHNEDGACFYLINAKDANTISAFYNSSTKKWEGFGTNQEQKDFNDLIKDLTFVK